MGVVLEEALRAGDSTPHRALLHCVQRPAGIAILLEKESSIHTLGAPCAKTDSGTLIAL